MAGNIALSEGSGGKDMADLIATFKFKNRGRWAGWDSDSATLPLGGGKRLAYTTDSYVVTPQFFPGGDIGRIAACGTINDLAVAGAEPAGLSVAFVLEEGYPKSDLERIIASIDKVSKETGVPVATGDTKVMERGKVDGIIVNTSGVGIVPAKGLLDRKTAAGDKVILSGGLGEHATAILSRRFDFETSILSDGKPLLGELRAVRSRLKVAKDVTRGGLAAVANELSQRCGAGMLLYEESIPVKREVRTAAEMLGLDALELACEGRFVCVAGEDKAKAVVKRLRTFNRQAAIIGEITDGRGVVMQTILGRRLLPSPRGRIVPRIC
jgi:hydrogenase expression/formation protein HypE